MTIAAAPPDDEARRIVREAIDDTVVVEAAAGTGKTTELVNRILRVIARGRAAIHEIVAVTFTERAAGELKLRVRQGLEVERAAVSDPEAASRLDAAIEHLEDAHIGTIHGFCADLLRERPVEARIDPMFRVLTERQAERLFDQAFDAWFQASLEDPPEGVRRSLRRPSRPFRSGEVDEDGPRERLRRAGLELTQWRDLRGRWTRDPFDRAGQAGALVALVHQVADLSAQAMSSADPLYVDTEPIRRLSRQLHADPELAGRDLDGLEAYLADLARDRELRRARRGTGGLYGKGIVRAAVVEARDRLLAALDDFQQRADADLAACLHGELLACVDAYEAIKQREGAVDFLDLLIRARDLVRDNAEVRRDFQKRFRRIFVDEFQDTDPLQAELLLLLASGDPEETRWERVRPEPGKLFIVGDPKQSIYRFRRADVAVYQQVAALLVERGARRVELRRSFRSVRNILRAVNTAFAPSMHPHYTPLEPHRPDPVDQPSLIALPVPRPYGRHGISQREIEASLPDAVGAFVDWLIRSSGWTVTERPNVEERVPVQARHVCILFRRLVGYGNDVTRPYVEALEARGIRHLLVGGRAFHGREEVEALRVALTAIEWPDDQLSIFATLRGPLFAIGDQELLEYSHLCRSQLGPGKARFHPFVLPGQLPEHLEPIRDALAFIAELHRRRNRVPVADTIAALLDRTRAHVAFALRPGGEQALANVLHIGELARQYERDGGLSFRGFVEELQQAASAGEGAEAPILEESSDGVRLMTVHKAKGLEFPVVILADVTARLTPRDAGRYLDAARGVCAIRIGGWAPKELNDHRETELEREREEAERVAYVAATRARDLLVVPTLGDGPYGEGWTSPLNAALYPDVALRRVLRPAPGCPPFPSRDSVLARPDGDPASPLTVCPGLHTIGPPDAPHTVVWWAPQALDLGAEAPFGLRRDDLIVKHVEPEVVDSCRSAYERWRTRRDDAIEAAGRPSLVVLTATEAAARPTPLPLDDIDVRIEAPAATDPRPSGPRFGTLVHAVLADIPLDMPSGDAIARLVDVHARLVGADAGECAAARTLVASVLAHPVLQAAARAAQAGRCYRETPVTLRLDGGELVEGYVDLAFDDGERFVVVDFKTDRELDGALERYRRQVQIYAAGIARATGRPVAAVLMRL